MSQTYENIEIVICDDSTDGTYEIAKQYTLKKVIVFKGENKGPAPALNLAIKKAKGKYIATCAADDMLCPEYVEECMKEFKDNVGMVSTLPLFVNEDGEEITESNDARFKLPITDNRTKEEWQKTFRTGNVFLGGSIVPKSVYEELGCYDENVTTLADYDFNIRLSKKYNIFVVQQKLYKFTLRHDALSAPCKERDAVVNREHFYIIDKYIEPKTPGISLCMICCNNEDTIETALKSAVGVFDEIVVVDTGSTDQTMNIVKKYTDKLFQTPWEDDFAKARNYGIDRASYSQIFWMDSDDELPEDTKFAIRSIAKDNNQHASYMFRIHNIIKDELGAKWLNDYDHLKLFPNKEYIRFANTANGHMHEGVVESILNAPIEIRGVDFSIIHHGYETIDKIESKIQRNIRICMNRSGYYYQFRIENIFFVFIGNDLFMWKTDSSKEGLYKADSQKLSFGAHDNMSASEILIVIEKANKMIEDDENKNKNEMNLLAEEIRKLSDIKTEAVVIL